MRLLPDLFDDVADRYPDHVALEVPPGVGRPERLRLTYAELRGQARSIAAGLHDSLDGEAIVAILLGRESGRLHGAQIGVMMAGAAYLCLEPTQPDERLRLLLDDAAPVRILTDAAGVERARSLVAAPDRVIDVETLPPAPERLPRPPWLGPDTLAYVIYTSGTTGKPKGVLIEHRGVANLVASDLEVFDLGPGDRASQNSSAAYDSSVEETWLALSCGATLVIIDDATVRLGPDLIDWLARERMTVLCPPPTLLRTTGCTDPASALPDLRLLYVGGEALPRDLADLWARGCRLENGYGPTECTVTVLRATIRPGEPITIGEPIAGHRAWAVDTALEPVPDGEEGELVIAGPGLARGYLRRDEETTSRFVEHPAFGRIYRTGDLVRREPSRAFVYRGRIDTQVKIRGHRIELEEIEARLAAASGVREAACRVQGEGPGAFLVAFVVAEDASRPPDLDVLRADLARELPEAMVPARFTALDRLPRSTGDKLDRRSLPEVRVEGDASDDGERAATELEERVAAAVTRVLDLGRSPSVAADFFNDLGGDSLRAAMLISELRRDERTASLAVRDVYEARDVRGLAARAESTPLAAPAEREERPRRSPHGATAVQAAWILTGLITAGVAIGLVVFWVLPWLLAHVDIYLLLLAAPILVGLLGAIWTPFSVAVAVAFKWILIGRYRPMRAPVWGGFFIRNWIVQGAVRGIPWGLVRGTELQSWFLRLLGARIGRNVHFDRGVDLLSGGWDLLEIGDGAVIGRDAGLRLVELDDGDLLIGPVRVGAGASLDTRAGLSAGASLGDGSHLTAHSLIPFDATIEAGVTADGIPASATGPAPRPLAVEPALGPGTHTIALIAARWLTGALAALPGLLLVVGVCLTTALTSNDVLDWAFRTPLELSDPILAALVALLVLSMPLGFVALALLARRLAPPVGETASRRSWTGIRFDLVVGLVEAAGLLLSGALFWPPWLRLAGMRVGRRCEISTIMDVVPSHLEIGAESFFADGIYLGGPHAVSGGFVTSTTRLGPGTFLGNHAVIPAGTGLPPNTLLGISTVADERMNEPGTSWFGCPAFLLPRREIVTADRELTHEPGALRYSTRVFWESLRFFVPAFPMLLAIFWLKVLAPLAALDATFLLITVPAVSLGAAAAACGGTLLTKWSLLGRVKPGQHPLWSCWCSRWDFLYIAWGAWARPLVAVLEGTVMIALWMRSMGCRVGRRAVLGHGFAQMVDPDMIDIGDEATVSPLFQAHSFEDRVLKIDRLHIERRATVGANTVILYGARIGEATSVLPHGVVMKHERLQSGRTYVGAPTHVRAR